MEWVQIRVQPHPCRMVDWEDSKNWEVNFSKCCLLGMIWWITMRLATHSEEAQATLQPSYLSCKILPFQSTRRRKCQMLGESKMETVRNISSVWEWKATAQHQEKKKREREKWTAKCLIRFNSATQYSSSFLLNHTSSSCSWLVPSKHTLKTSECHMLWNFL